MKFLLQHNMLAADQLEIIRHAVQDLPHEWVGLIPFSHEVVADLPIDGVDYIPYGSTSLTNWAAESKFRGVFFDRSIFNYYQALQHRDDMLNQPVFLGNLETGIAILDEHEKDEMFFMRPSEDLKQFSGQVISAGEAVVWLRSALECASSGNQQLLPNTQIVISKPVDIQAEWRWFIVGGKVVSGSMYRLRGHMHRERVVDQSVIDEAQLFANKWLPSQCCVMDTALVGGELKVIEFNCINSSGMYDNDVPAIFTALYKFCEKM